MDDIYSEEVEKTSEERLADEKFDRYIQDIRFLLNTEEGRRFLKSFFVWCNLLSIYPGQNSGIYFHEGHRNCGKKIWEDVCLADPVIAAKLQVEMTMEEREKA